MLSYHKLYKFLLKNDDNFVPALSQRVNLKEYCEKLIDKATIFCEEWGRDIVAVLAGYMNDVSKQMAYISLIVVDKNARRHGLATKLLKQFIQEAEKRGFRRVELETDKTNIAAKTLYEGMGFKIMKKTSNKLHLYKEINQKETKKIMVTQSSLPPLEEYVEEIKDIWESKWLTNMGCKHKELQEKLVDYLGVEKIDLLTNGHMALELSLQALNLPRGGEVITTPFTFASTTHAIVRNGLKPVFCDINPDDFTMDVSKIEGLITPKTCAIMPVHVYGNICDVEKIDEIAQKHNLKVVYDAAHTFGVKYKGVGIGNFGDVSCFSFHATKVFNTIEGGAVCFKNEQFGKEIYKLKNFGIKNQEVVDGVGANAKMNEFCAAMGICNLRHIKDEIAKRKKVVERYRKNLMPLTKNKGIMLNPTQKDVQQNYAYFPVVFNEEILGYTRDDVKNALEENGVFSRKYFYPITNAFECYEGQFDPKETPIALRTSKRVLTLPLYADLELADVDRICNIIKNLK